ncbi:hypothetical protein R1flu_003750 [Riccia fluitans]|uniref:Cupin type-2 domain-containing protein n=1 Tax=Riccia fluitans TaxID=41844 RepID=A0ABD1YA15_9MARC
MRDCQALTVRVLFIISVFQRSYSSGEGSYSTGKNSQLGVDMDFSVDNSLGLTLPDRTTQVWAFGVLVTMRLLGHQTGGTISSFEDEVLPGASAPFHYHTKEDETFIMLEGNLTWIAGEKEHAVSNGAALFIPRGTPHSFRNDSGKKARMLVIYTPAGQEQWFLDVGKPVEDPEKPPEVTPEDMKAAVKLGVEQYGMVFLPPKAAPAAKDEL